MSSPAWLNDDAAPAASSSSSAAPVTAVPVSSDGEPVASGKAAPPHKALVNSVMTFVTMGVSVMMAASGALVVGQANSVNDTGVVFIGLYMCLFAAILFLYELIQIKPIEKVDRVYKENFGFLYGPNGRGIYMFFTAIIAFGMRDFALALATGILVAAWGICVIGIHMKWPDYFDVKIKYKPPLR
mmetsp:Transcript_107925/g.232487  ORF Transcript_107925/g.232487 Transcript_107925/m.232487 type:complete len:185 (-) Transcript_107925:105-659(-)